MSQFCIYLKLEPYLRDWFINDCGGGVPVHLRKGSAESDILLCFLQKQPSSTPDLPSDEDVAIFIPTFKDKDPRVYNYLGASGKRALKRCIKTRFDVELWRDLQKFAMFKGHLKQDLIYAWMETHHIEINETNWCAIDKCYYRKRRLYKKNIENNSPISFD